MSEKKTINIGVISKDIFDIEIRDRDTGQKLEGVTRLVWEALPNKQILTLEFDNSGIPVKFRGEFVGEIVKEDEENESVQG